MTLIAVVTTLPSREDAIALASSLVESHLAACAQIDAIESLYLWQGELRQEPEWRLTLKTTRGRYEAIEAAILARHPYELPAIHALELDRASTAYREWITSMSRDDR